MSSAKSEVIIPAKAELDNNNKNEKSNFDADLIIIKPQLMKNDSNTITINEAQNIPKLF